MIQMAHVYKNFEGSLNILRNVDLFIDKGEFVFLTGPSGAGKTTIFRLISAFDRPTSGQMKVCGQNTENLPPRELAFFRRQIGMVFQDFKLLKNRTVAENVELPLKIHGERTAVSTKKVSEMLDRLGLYHKRDQTPVTLSGGEQQRVAIARALIHKPGVLIADEPTGNLDAEMGEEIMNLLEQANAQGTTVFVATHDLDLVARRQKRHIQIRDGQLYE
jgi:cell division transport system ATP-binding protein